MCSLDELAQEAVADNQQAFRSLVERTQQKVYRVTLRVLGNHADAEEATQEAFLRAWKQLDRFRFRAAITTWICQIAMNVSIDMVRKKKRERIATPQEDDSIEENWVEQFPSGEPDPARQIELRQLQLQIREVLEEMKPKHRLVFSLREIDGLSYEEIAEAVGCAPGTVESRLHRARKIFQKKWKKRQGQ
jgi:RNA polymerase sigma-70 factor, ECF subfamily